MSSIKAPATYSQPSRKGKRAWRKNVDITGIQEGLEQLREEIIHGGVISEKPDEELFTIDTTGSKEIARKHFKTAKPLKMDEILAARSAVPALGWKHPVSTGVTDGVIEKRKKRRDGVPFRELERLKRLADRVEAPQAANTGLRDLWGEMEADMAVKVGELELGFLEKQKKVKEPVTLKLPPVSMAAVAEKVPAVRMPEGGISYNPQFAQWDEILQREGAAEVEVEKQRLAAEAEAARIRALSQVEDAVEDEDTVADEEEEEEDEQEEKEVVAKKLPDRKTKAQRNKLKRRKELERMHAQQQRLKHQARELQLVKQYTKDLEAKEKLRRERIEAAKAAADDETNPKVMRKRKFGMAKMPRPPLELQLPDELAESLRTLKPEGSLLRDRMRSIRERGLVETRLPVVERRKFKRLKTEKWSYKDFK